MFLLRFDMRMSDENDMASHALTVDGHRVWAHNERGNERAAVTKIIENLF